VFVQEHFDPPARYAEFVLDYLRTRNLPPEVARYLAQLEN
jgi:hypothetical protein